MACVLIFQISQILLKCWLEFWSSNNAMTFELHVYARHTIRKLLPSVFCMSQRRRGTPPLGAFGMCVQLYESEGIMPALFILGSELTLMQTSTR